MYIYIYTQHNKSHNIYTAIFESKDIGKEYLSETCCFHATALGTLFLWPPNCTISKSHLCTMDVYNCVHPRTNTHLRELHPRSITAQQHPPSNLLPSVTVCPKNLTWNHDPSRKVEPHLFRPLSSPCRLYFLASLKLQVKMRCAWISVTISNRRTIVPTISTPSQRMT